MYVQLSKPVTLQTKTDTLSLTSGKVYALSFYVLDSAGNITIAFKNPVLVVKLDGTDVYTYTADSTHLLYSSSFSSGTQLAEPIDSNYIQLKTTITAAQTGSNALSFTLSDQSSADHMYAIRGITLKYIQHFDSNARANVASCPANSF